ncbi:oxysterol-binding protein-related protein 10-like [Sinocyclocheilus anshuiensis]|uniref:oxysterol-binding protein-related protein 10-like n=1 Tax=Sinocyclocheilus anshuiensis TaxID=1608454 RepID=UPI0007B7F03C|nr:PREDICTED: oxysterol-binding protein-related protein 10-like [Sinocyclocheilus anshuiensis]
MEKTLNVSHSGSSKGKWSADLGNPAHRQARSGSYSPGTGAVSDTHPSQTQKRHLEGVLNKYTNLLQGWQNRYFVLDPELGQLQYFINEHSKNQKPRGSLPLIGSSVAPCEEFPYMFTVCAANGDFFKLRACDAREQQMWMTQLQLCARRHSDGSAKGCTSSSCNTSFSSSTGRTRSFSLHPHPIPQCSSISAQRQTPQHGTPASVITITHHKSPTASQRTCSQHPAGLYQVKEVMSQAEGQQKNLVNSIESLPSRGPLSSLDQDLLLLKATSAATLSCLGECLSILQHNVCQAAQHITHSHMQGSNTDNVSNWSRPKTASEGHVKIGELTHNNTSTRHQPHSPLHRNNERLKDTERNSVISIPTGNCSSSTASGRSTFDPSGAEIQRQGAELHPPSSALLSLGNRLCSAEECVPCALCFTLGVLHLLEHDEEYVFTLPSAYARSILTVPWVELGGKVSICCAKSGYSSTVTFHTKPFYGGKVHRVTAEVKHNPSGTIVCKAQGEWNGTLEFTYSSGETKVIDTSKLPVIKKKIRPLEKQGLYESRRLWQHVTAALKAGDIDAASENKHQLEEKQRREGKQRTASSTTWKPKYFIKEGDGWVYHNSLWKTK